MSRLARFCAQRRFVVLGVWLVVLVALGGAALTAGAKFTNETTMPDSESAQSYRLLDELSPDSSAVKTGNIAWRTTGVDVNAASVRAEVGTVLTKITSLPGVTQVVSPYTSEGAAQLDPAKDVAFATVTLSPDADLDQIRSVAKSVDSPTLEVQTGGTAFYEDPAAGGIAELVGVAGALLVLLLVFRSVWAAVLPILTGVVGVVVSLFTVMLASHVVNLSDSTPTMGALIGLGVGIDYALFIVNRYRKGLMAGQAVPDAIAKALDTSGRAVLFAGATVIIALLGMFVVQISVLTGMARGAALTVLLTVAAATTLLPALMATLGRRVLSRRQRAELARSADASAPSRLDQKVQLDQVIRHSVGRPSMVQRWAALVERRPRTLAIAASLLMLMLAIPALGIRLGSADASSDPSTSDSNAYYTMMSQSFGEGFDASLLIVGSTPDSASTQAFKDLAGQLTSVDGVASVKLAPMQPGQQVAIATVIPTHSAQTEATANLVQRIRDNDIPPAEKGTHLQVFVGGTTASNIDNAAAITQKLPIYLLLIAVLGFALLAIAFRSILVPLIGSLANLLTLAVALGAVTAIFQLGWGSGLLGVGSAAPIESIVPVLVIGVMFGLSMDYQVFLVSRMHEEWTQTHNNARAVRVGLRETGLVIATAAIIMLSVFASFGFGGVRIVAQIGIGLAVAVLADAFVLRMTVVPAIMHLIGDRNWAYPRFLERITPHISVEGAAPAPPAPVLVSVGAPAPGAE